MKRAFYNLLGLLGMAMSFPTASLAQDKLEASVDADIVSSYIWRGQDLGNVSLQPTLSLSYKGWWFTAWGSTGFNREDTREIDLTLGYATGGFSASVTDYWTDNGAGFLHYGAHHTSHVLEAQVGYDFGPVALNWYTNFAGTDGVTASGRRAYSSYASVSVPFRLAGLEWTAEVGATPWGTDFYNYIATPDDEEIVCNGSNRFAVCDLSLEASKEIPISSSFSLPVFARLTLNPRTECTYVVFGLSF